MQCGDIDPLIQLQLDGEIDERELAEVETHLRACAPCRSDFELERSFQERVRARLKAGEAPAQLGTSVRRALATAEPPARTWRPETRARRIAPWVTGAAAAAVLVALTWGAHQPELLVVDDAVARHTRNLPPEVRASDPGRVREYLKEKLPFAIHVPRFPAPNIELVGARLSNIRDREAAYLMYDRAGAKVSLFAYPAGAAGSIGPFGSSGEPWEGARRHHAGARDVVLSSARGYNVVTWDQAGVAYSLVSDIDEGEMLRLVSSASTLGSEP